MEFFGMSGNAALQETEEPQEHIVTEFSKDKLRLIHRLCWRDGLDTQYTVPLDGSVQPIPPAMIKRAASSWKKNDLSTWEHAWDHGEDGNPLHFGLRTQQKLFLKDTNYTLRYWRNLIRPGEMRINVEVTYADTGKYAIHTQRFFHKIDVSPVYAISCLPTCPTPEELVAKLLTTPSSAGAGVSTYDGHGTRLVVFPHASNMPVGWQSKLPRNIWELADPFPAAGRDCGPFLKAIRNAAWEAGLWVVCGVTLRAKDSTVDEDAVAPKVVKAVALIGADGWLHGVHVDAAPKESVYSAGTGDWPATQTARPNGVYDTELGRIATCASVPDKAGEARFADMGAEIVVIPPDTCSEKSGSGVVLKLGDLPFKYYTNYDVCGPDHLESKHGQKRTLVVASMTGTGFKAVQTTASTGEHYFKA
jgi:hypothetical protein